MMAPVGPGGHVCYGASIRRPSGRLLAVAASAAAIAALAGCGGNGHLHSVRGRSPSPTAHAAVAAHKPRAKAPPSAVTVIRYLARRFPIRLSVVYTASTDPNHLLGRPGGYTSKAAFVDRDIPASQATDTELGSIELGGGVEVYPTAAGAWQRAQYLRSVVRRFPIVGDEYDYVDRGVLLRLSDVLTPAQAAAFGRALAAELGVPARLAK
jgi:hypothetical protein